MPRIAGINLPKNKRIEIALTYLYGVGRARSNKLLLEAGIDKNIRTDALTEEQEGKLRQIIDRNYKVEGELRREVLGNIRLLQEIGSYRGSRHKRHLPVRGQRTRTNSRTVRGNVRRTMGSGRAKSAEKT